MAVLNIDFVHYNYLKETILKGINVLKCFKLVNSFGVISRRRICIHNIYCHYVISVLCENISNIKELR